MATINEEEIEKKLITEEEKSNNELTPKKKVEILMNVNKI